jgi:signal peptidase I
MTRTGGEKRVCPECGSPAGEAPFCVECGQNLSNVRRLPRRSEWEASRLQAELDRTDPSSGRLRAPSVSPNRSRWLIPGAVLGVLAAIATLFIGLNKTNTEVYEMPSESMRPTFNVGDRLEVNVEAYDDDEPKSGEIIGFHAPAGASRGNTCGVPRTPRQACAEPTAEPSDTKFIKRIVGVPGDRLSIDGGVAVVNGAPLQEDYITPCRGGGSCNLPNEITIPPDHYFVLGDNRGASDDSRYWGPVKRDWIIGRVEN